MNEKSVIIYTFKNKERIILGTLTGDIEFLENIKKEKLPFKKPSEYDNIYIAIDGLEYKVL